MGTLQYCGSVDGETFSFFREQEDMKMSSSADSSWTPTGQRDESELKSFSSNSDGAANSNKTFVSSSKKLSVPLDLVLEPDMQVPQSG